MKLLRIFALPGAGSSAVMYYKLIPYMADNLRLTPVEIPGRGMKIKMAALQSRTELIQSLQDEILKKIKDDEDYVILGNSFGSILAYDICTCIEKAGAPAPKHLFLAVEPPPHVIINKPKMSETKTSLPFIRSVFLRFFDMQMIDEEEVQAIISVLLDYFYNERESFLSMSATEVYRKIYGYRHDIDPKKIQLLEFGINHINLFIQDEDIIYQESMALERIKTNITVFGGTKDEVATMKELQEWNQYTSGHFNIHMLEGGHLILFTDGMKVIERIVTTMKMKAGDMNEYSC